MGFPTERYKCLNIEIELASEVDAYEDDDWGQEELEELIELLDWVTCLWALRTRFTVIGFTGEEI